MTKAQFKLSVLDKTGKEVSRLELPEQIFGEKINEQLIA